jgi:hypothetical protein
MLKSDVWFGLQIGRKNKNKNKTYKKETKKFVPLVSMLMHSSSLLFPIGLLHSLMHVTHVYADRKIGVLKVFMYIG